MIKIKRSKIGPIIYGQGKIDRLKNETLKNNSLYDGDPMHYDDRTKKLTFDSALYGHDKIKDQLRNSQNGKCAFCEQNTSSVSHGDIEHFRPKAGYCQNGKDSLHGPGYYWVAYEWDNLLFACQICNQRHKKNLFPLTNPELRALNHHGNIVYEKPFFINPALENPKFLIGFKKAVAYGKDKKHRGKKTIEAIGLNRKGAGISDLFEIRNEYYEKIEMINVVASAVANESITQDKIDKAKQLMTKFRNRKSQFSSMVQENFPR